MAQHHMNVIACRNGALYLSMVSIAGSWNSGAHDRWIFVSNAVTLASIGSVVNKSGMSHSFSVADERIWSCELLPGVVTRGQQHFEIAFPILCRDLSFAANRRFAGLSKNETGWSSPLSGGQIGALASGGCGRSESNRMAGFIPMEGSVPEIHSFFCLASNGE